MNAMTATVGKEDFLRLFTTQLKYQNPLNPMDGTEFTAQLAQFSSLEQLVNMGKTLDDILSYQDSLNNALATNLMGKMIRVDGDLVNLDGSAEIIYEIPEDVAEMTMNIYGSSGEVVRSVELGGQHSGEGKYIWDGTDNKGDHLPDGFYRVEFVATGVNGSSVAVSSETLAMVRGVSFDGGVTYLELDSDTRVSLNEVKEIWEGGTR